MKEIEDSGEVIPNAKKHAFADGKKQKKEPKPVSKESGTTLKQYWPEPDWQDLESLGASRECLASIYVIYHSLRRTPVDSGGYVIENEAISIDDWEAAFCSVVVFLKEELSKAKTLSDVDDVEVKFNKHFEHWETYAVKSGGTRTISQLFPLRGKAVKLKELIPYLDFPGRALPKKIGLFPIKFNNDDGESYYRLCKLNKKSYSWTRENNLFFKL